MGSRTYQNVVTDLDASLALTRTPGGEPNHIASRRMQMEMCTGGDATAPYLEIARARDIGVRTERVEGGFYETSNIKLVPAVQNPADKIGSSVPPHGLQPLLIARRIW